MNSKPAGDLIDCCARALLRAASDGAGRGRTGEVPAPMGTPPSVRHCCSSDFGRRPAVKSVITALARRRGHRFGFERAVFLTVLHRLMRGGGVSAAHRWRDGVSASPAAKTSTCIIFTVPWPGSARNCPCRSRRCDAVRTTLQQRSDRGASVRASADLLSGLDLVFMDTTSLYFRGPGRPINRQYGYSKDHRPDLRQMILAVLIDGDGRPVCRRCGPATLPTSPACVTGNRPAAPALLAIGRLCVVADRGMISAETIAAIEARGLLYILGVPSAPINWCAMWCSTMPRPRTSLSRARHRHRL